MILNWKVLLGCAGLAMASLTGCSGINASSSVSPATFLIPGLMQVDPKPEQPDTSLPVPTPALEPAHQVARL